MPQDDQSSPATDARVAAIKADLKYFKDAAAKAVIGGHPPTVYGAKYAEDVEFLLKLAGLEDKAEPPPAPQPDSVEGALAHDEASRVERKPRRP